MLFNSLEFIFAFLPVTIVVFFLLRTLEYQAAAWWLVGTSFLFYILGPGPNLILLVVSIGVNYGLGLWLATKPSRIVLAAGLAANLAPLVYFKYAGLPGPIPLAISFFTFTQIAFLVDAYKGKVSGLNLRSYSLFVTYYPHLIAGPIVHHEEMRKQFDNEQMYRFDAEMFASGLTIFIIGLFKKIGLADSIAPFADQAFELVASGQSLGMAAAWLGAASYTLQLYFDFSGYCDMAVGLSLMLGFHLPFNFNSPYKAIDIIDFWRRWHMTLSRFLKDYVYIPLGGNRRGVPRRYMNLLITMVVGGVWHGAGWTFFVWGVIHGILLALNHGLRAARVKLGYQPVPQMWWARGISHLVTFVLVIVAWVVFRAPTFEIAQSIIGSMFGGDLGALDIENTFFVGVGLIIVWFLPNSQQITLEGGEWLRWKSNVAWATTSTALFVASVFGIILATNASPFLYFNF